MKNPLFKVFPYTEEELSKQLSNKDTSNEIVRNKNHFTYLVKYLGKNGLNAQTIVVEEKYVSKDYLHDYASYYAFSFKEYSKFCKRIHFFDIPFTDEEFTNVVLDGNDKYSESWKHYLGFIVVKPIPVTIIGYTVLKPIPANSDTHFFGLRNYIVHLFGCKANIESLAFQEQDTVLAACATTAIWSTLNKASIDDHTILKSPSQITRDADILSVSGSRLFPNREGLSVLQICKAIFNSGLVTEIKFQDYDVKNDEGDVEHSYVSIIQLKKIVNAYSEIGIPIILVVEVPYTDSSSPSHNNEKTKEGDDKYGYHALTISGFERKRSDKKEDNKTGLIFLAEDITKIYAHDDQYGPFSEIIFLNDYEIFTEWTVTDKTKRPTFIYNIIVPVYPKIRISYEEIELITVGIDTIFKAFLRQLDLPVSWDIKLHYSEQYKSEIRHSILSNDRKVEILKSSMPKYLWIASFYINDIKFIDFTFDGTDVSTGMMGSDIVCYYEKIKPGIAMYLTNNRKKFQTLFNHSASINYYDFLIEKFS